LSPIEILLAVLFLAALGVGVWFGFHLLTENGRLMLRLDTLEQALVQQGVLSAGIDPSAFGRPPGSVLNDFALPLLSGGTMTLSQWRGRKVALIFLNPRCKHCEVMLPELAAALPPETAADPAPIIVSTGTVEENRKFFGDRFSCPIVLQEDSEVAALYLALATPMAYLVGENGATIGSALLGGSAIINLYKPKAQASEPVAEGHSRVPGLPLGSRINRDGLKAGTTAPDFTLPALDGAEVSLKSFRGRPLLLVFSDPNCAPCNEVLPKLEEIHRHGDVKVLVISRGDPEANRKKVKQLRLTLPMVLQKSWEISRAYGMFATPIGYLVGEDGVLLADVAPGGNAILALAAPTRSRGARVA
jgi:methylamine dehydrogenase accessory protein MauD